MLRYVKVCLALLMSGAISQTNKKIRPLCPVGPGAHYRAHRAQGPIIGPIGPICRSFSKLFYKSFILFISVSILFRMFFLTFPKLFYTFFTCFPTRFLFIHFYTFVKFIPHPSVWVC